MAQESEDAAAGSKKGEVTFRVCRHLETVQGPDGGDVLRMWYEWESSMFPGRTANEGGKTQAFYL